ncbi:hypothetical protein G9A89_006715 [Geosiphon pyriformis]|nr:hypothetical protein G9A89_006715 [Geosiphon pyriformis]
MKKSVKGFGLVNSKKSIEKNIAFRKKKKDSVLKNSIASKLILSNKAVGNSWESEAGNTTKSNSVDIEEKCLVKKTSVNYGKKSLFIEGNSNQTPKILDILLGKINFLDNISNNNILLDTPVILSLSLKNLVNVSSMVLGEAFTSSKFSGIICAFFTSESSLAQTTEKAKALVIQIKLVIKKIPVGISAEAVHIAFFEFGSVVLIKMQLVGLWQKAVVKFAQSDQADLVAVRWFILIEKNAIRVAKANTDKKSWDIRDQHRTLLYILLISTNVHDIWDFIGSVGRKTCIIDQHPVIYA